jgi:arylsulfatase A-like enzyme
MSLKPLLQGHKPKLWRESVYYHYYEFPGAHSVRRHYGVRTNDHKLMYFYNLKEWELYDLKKDPHELHNVHGDPAYAKVAAELKAELARLRKLYKVPEDTRPVRRPPRRRPQPKPKKKGA